MFDEIGECEGEQRTDYSDSWWIDIVADGPWRLPIEYPAPLHQPPLGTHVPDGAVLRFPHLEGIAQLHAI